LRHRAVSRSIVACCDVTRCVVAARVVSGGVEKIGRRGTEAGGNADGEDRPEDSKEKLEPHRHSYLASFRNEIPTLTVK
jgi:hypothetical protein